MAHRSLFSLSCITFMIFTSYAIHDPPLTFTDFAQANYKTLLVTVHNVTGDVFMASLDTLYHLDADLVLKKKVATGPHSALRGGNLPCSETTLCENRTLDGNLPIAMSLVYHLETDYIILCGTLYDGLCQLRPLDDLDRFFWIGPYDDPVAMCVKNRNNIAFFGPGHGNQIVFYSGTDWQPRSNDSSEALPFFSSKVLVQDNGQFRFRYSYQSNSSQSAVFLKFLDKKYVLRSFIHGSYVYVLFVREFETVLARICVEDGTFTSYVEQPISCVARPNYYTTATAAFFGSGLHWYGSSFRPMEHLYVSFAKSTRQNTVQTLICYYSIELLNRIFDASIEDCFGNASYTYRINLETGRLLQCNRKVDSDMCGSTVNPYIRSKKVAEEARNTIHIQKTQSHAYPTSLAFFEQNGMISGFVGTKGESFVSKFVGIGVAAGDTIHSLYEESDIQPSLAFDLKKEHIYYLSLNKIVKYPIRTCSLHKTCAECFGGGARDPLRCGWCNGHCLMRQECPGKAYNRGNCSPTIYSVRPLIGPTKGGTHLTITGKNFGTMSGLDTLNYVTINREPCEILLWEMEKVICVTRPSSTEMAAPVALNVRDVRNRTTLGFAYIGLAESKENFLFVDVKFTSITPDRGSIAGGTHVTLTGTHLDIGERYGMNIRGRFCMDLKINKTFVSCITGKTTDPYLKDTVELKMDNIYVKLDGDNSDTSEKFQYLPDPIINGMYPTDAVLSYSSNVTIIGEYLDSAEAPYMLVNMQSRKRFDETQEVLLKQKCWQSSGSNGTSMICATPVLDSEKFSFPDDGQPIVAEVNFDVYPFKANIPEKLQLSFYPEPEFQDVQTILDNQTSLEIKGKFPGAGSLAYLTSVQIGENEPCNISELTVDTLHCEFRPGLLTDASALGKNLTVKVTRGTSDYKVGYLVIKDLEKKEAMIQKAWPVVLALALLALLFVSASVAWCFCRKRRQDNSLKVLSPVKFKNGYATDPVNLPAKTPPEYANQPLMPRSRNPPTTRIGTIQADSESLIDALPGDSASYADSVVFHPSVAWQQDAAEEIMSLDDTLRILAGDGWIIPEDHLTLGSVVGEGHHGSVYKGKYNSPKHGTIEVAVKTIYESPDLKQTTVCEFLKEGLQMKNFKHENVLTLIGVCFEEDMPMIVLPFMQNGDLCSYLRNKDNDPSQLDLLGFAVQVAAGMEYLANNKFVHRDLAARNCLISSDMTVKVADFGLSRDTYESDYYRIQTKSRKLPFGWMPPECLELGKFTEKSDVWSYGIVLWEIMSHGATPYEELNLWGITEFLKLGGRLPQPPHCSQDLYRVMRSCWEYDPTKRPSFEVLHRVVKQLWTSASCNDDTKQPDCAQNQLYFAMED